MPNALLPKLVIILMILLTFAEVGCQRSEPVEVQKADSIQQQLLSFAYLNSFVGKSPDAVSMWQSEPLRSQLLKVVGDSLLENVLDDFKNAKVVKRDHVIYTISALPDSLINGYTVALLDTVEASVDVLYIQKDSVIELKSGKEKFYWPDEVRNLMFNFQNWMVYEGQLPCEDCDEIRTSLAIDKTDSVFSFFLQQTYSQAENKSGNFDDSVRQYYGRGKMQIAQDTVLVVQSDKMEIPLKFLKLGRQNLEVLDDDAEREENPVVLKSTK